MRPAPPCCHFRATAGTSSEYTVSAAISPWRNRTQRPSFKSMAGITSTLLLSPCSEWKFFQHFIHTVLRQLVRCDESPAMDEPHEVLDHRALAFIIVADPQHLPIRCHHFDLKPDRGWRARPESTTHSLLIDQHLPDQGGK